MRSTTLASIFLLILLAFVFVQIRQYSPEKIPLPIPLPIPFPPTQSVKFGGWIQSVSYNNIWQATKETVDVELKTLDDLGVQIYSIHPNYDVFLRNDVDKIALLDYVFEQAKAKGKLVQISGAGAESWRANKITPSEFRRFYLERAEIYTKRWQPWAFEILQEPNGWMDFTNPKMTPKQWADLSAEVSAVIKKSNPSTVTLNAFIVSTDMNLWRDEVETMKLTLKDSNLDAVGFDIYGNAGQDDKTPLIEPYIPVIKQAGKKLWIPETWGRGGPMIKATGENAAADIAFAKHIVEWADKNEVEGLIWFFTMLFGSPENYTETFYGIKGVISG